MSVNEQHAVHLYADDASLARHVARHVTSSPAGLVVAPRDHLRHVLRAIAQRGDDPVRRVQDGRLALLDAERVLEDLLVDGRPDEQRFHDCIGRRIDALLRHGPVHAHGELVDLLWQRGRLDAALELEDLWKRFLKARPVRLLCAYRMDLADHDCTAAMEAVCARHGMYVGPSPDAEVRSRFETAMGRHASALHHLAMQASHATQRLPEAHRLVFWTRRHLPRRLTSTGPRPARPRTRPSVLVLEDDPDDVVLLRMAALRTIGAPRLHTVPDIAAATAWLARQTERDRLPDLVVVALDRPGAASAAIASLKENAAWGHVPVLALGGATRPEDVRCLQAAGALAHYRKPEGIRGLGRILNGLRALALAMQEDQGLADRVRDRFLSLDNGGVPWPRLPPPYRTTTSGSRTTPNQNSSMVRTIRSNLSKSTGFTM